MDLLQPKVICDTRIYLKQKKNNFEKPIVCRWLQVNYSIVLKSSDKVCKMPPIPKAPPSMHDPKLLSRSHSATPGEDIVISGISGKFPNSRNVEEFAHNLYNKVQ